MKNHLIPNPELPTSYAGFPCSGLFSSVSEPCSVSREPFFHSSFSDFNFPGSDSFGFNGQEKDDEIYGEGASLSFEFRNYDSRIGRFWSVDPVLKNHESPYATFSGNPINRIDPEGMSDDIIIEGANNSSIVVETDIIDITISTDVDFGGNHTVDVSSVAIGYTQGGAGTATAAGGVNGSLNAMSALFLGGDYAGYWYDYKNTESQTVLTSGAQATVGVQKNWFIAFNKDPATNNPADFAGEYSGYAGSAGLGGLFLGAAINGQWATSAKGDWTVLSLGFSGSVGPQVSMLGPVSISAAVSVSGNTTLLTPLIPTNQRSSSNKLANWISHLF